MNIYRKAFLYLTVFVTGGAVLALEVLGARIISPFYGTTVFVWTSLIVVTLGALAVGYFIGGVIADKRPSENILYSIIFIASIFFLIPMKIDQWVLPYTDKFGFHYGPLVSAILLFFIPLFFLGMVSPFIIRLTTDEVYSSGKSSGIVFAVGTLGSILGGYLAGFYLLDKLSIERSLSFISIILFLFVFFGLAKNLKTKSAILSAFFLITILIVGNLPKHIYKDNYTLQILHHEQSRYGDLKVIEIAGIRCLVMDGATQSCTNLKTNTTVFGSVLEMGRIISDIATKKEEPTKVLLMGLGSGDLSKLLPKNVILDSVEIDPKVASLGQRFFTVNKDVNQNVYIDDARHFLSTTDKKYDIIVSDLSLGNTMPAYLFSQEAMRLMYSSLEENGVVLMHFSARNNDKDEIMSPVWSTANSVFDTSLITKVSAYEDDDELQSIILHLSKKRDYRYEDKKDSLYKESLVNISSNEIVTDSRNPLYKYSSRNIIEFRDSMINFGGYRMLFSS